MSPWHEWVWIQLALRNRGRIQFTFVIVAITGYCLLLGNYAITNYAHAVTHRTKPTSDGRQTNYAHAVTHRIKPTGNGRQVRTSQTTLTPLERNYALFKKNFAHAVTHRIKTGDGKQTYHYAANKLAHMSRQRAFKELTQPPAAGTVLPADLTAIEADLAARRRLVRDTCVARGLDNPDKPPNAWEFFIDGQHDLVWCNVFKAASSTWMYYFNLLGGFKEQYLRRSNKVPLILARSRFPRPSVAQLLSSLPRSLSFLVVREPFERLLSAYRNKIESYRHRFYRKMAHDIVARYRPPSPDVNADKRRERSPTFAEFVDYVVDNADKGFDEHWAPFHRFCTPCQVNFTVIAKLETFQRDEEYVIRKAHLERILKTDVQRRNPKSIKNQGKGGTSTDKLVEKYYGTLSRRQIDKLYEIYGIDFEMFGYNVTKYFHMAP